MATQASIETIREFLAQKRIAMVGLSRDPKHFSVYLFKELVRRGYDVVPVNPNAAEVDGRRCLMSVRDIYPPVESVLLMTTPAVTEKVVGECAAAGIKRVWMYRAGGKGAVSDAAVQVCRDEGMKVVPGECPFMFLPHPGFHGVHGFVRKITGRYPGHRAA